MKASAPRLIYLFVFVCEKCQHHICEPFHAEDPKVEFPVTCKTCGWNGTMHSSQAEKVMCQDAGSPEAG
jgi:hypothetical protein